MLEVDRENDIRNLVMRAVSDGWPRHDMLIDLFSILKFKVQPSVNKGVMHIEGAHKTTALRFVKLVEEAIDAGTEDEATAVVGVARLFC